MAWIYFQESAESHSHSGNGSDPSPIVKTIDTLKACCLAEWLTENCHEHQSGMTSPHSKDQCYPAELISSTADSLVRISPSQASESALQASVQDWSAKYGDWLMSYDRDTSSWRTLQPSLLPGLILSSPRLPNAGLMLSGYVFQQQTLERVISEIGGGYLPTPRANESATGDCNHKPACHPACKPTLTFLARKGLIPTPTQDGNYNRAGASAKSGDGLATAIARLMLPTPTARDWRDGTAQSCKNVEVNGLLGRAVHYLPTPKAQNSRGVSPKRDDLVSVVSQAGRDNLLKRWPTVPALCRTDDGIPNRVDRIKCLGNSVVPQCAEEAFKILMHLE